MNFNVAKYAELRNKLAALNRVKLAELPTPLQEAPRFAESLGGPRVLIKREDLTGLAFGGNKTRMFEFSLRKVIEEGYDTIIAGAAVQSNYSRQMAAACAKLGLEAHLFFRTPRGDGDLDIQGNLLLDLLAGANVTILKGGCREDQRLAAEELAERLRQRGRKPYIARGLHEHHIGYDAAAYANCLIELFEQLSERNERVDHIYVSSLDSTHAGLLFAAEYIEATVKILAVAPMIEIIRAKTVEERICNIGDLIAAILGVDSVIRPENILSTTDYVGAGYGLVSDESKEALALLASTEGIFLDPVYSSKAMAGLIDHIRKGIISKDETVVFIHTGGGPSLFAYADEFDLDYEQEEIF